MEIFFSNFVTYPVLSPQNSPGGWQNRDITVFVEEPQIIILIKSRRKTKCVRKWIGGKHSVWLYASRNKLRVKRYLLHLCLCFVYSTFRFSPLLLHFVARRQGSGYFSGNSRTLSEPLFTNIVKREDWFFACLRASEHRGIPRSNTGYISAFQTKNERTEDVQVH